MKWNSLCFAVLLSYFNVAGQTLWVPNGTSGIGSSTSGSGKVGIGVTSPIANLQVGQGTENSLINLGGYANIGSLRSSGDFFAGINAYASYSSSIENSKIKVLNSNSYGFAAMHLGYNGDINFYSRTGNSTAEEQINTAANSVLTIRGGNVGIKNSNPLGYLHVNPIRPVIIKNNGGNGVYGSEIGFNAILNTGIVPNQFKKLGGTSQNGGASMAVDYSGNILFQMFNGNTESEVITTYSPQIVFLNSGSVGIGTTSPDAKLAVKGTIHSNEVKVDLLGAVAPDYVFEKDYPLASLEELRFYIDQHKHLPEIPSAKEMEEEGINLKEMNLLLLKKVEELTLYLIDQKEINDKQQALIEKQGEELNTLKDKLQN